MFIDQIVTNPFEDKIKELEEKNSKLLEALKSVKNSLRNAVDEIWHHDSCDSSFDSLFEEYGINEIGEIITEMEQEK